jgi:4'-phosphopantetheinyl transferase
VVMLWKIVEDEISLRSMLPDYHPPVYRNAEHLLEHLAIRVMLEQKGYPYKMLTHHGNGQPIIPGKFISLTHCFPLVAAVIASHPVGIDVQKPVNKLDRIMPRYMNFNELTLAEKDPSLPLKLWCAKEALFKKFPLRHLAFREEIEMVDVAGSDLLFRVKGSEAPERVKLYEFHSQALAVTVLR